MQVRTYAKTNSISLDELIEKLNENYGGVWLKTSKLDPDQIEYLNGFYDITKPQLSLPSAKDETDNQPASITKSESVNIQQNVDNINPQTAQLTVSKFDQILDTSLALSQKHLEQKLEDDYTLLVETLNNHNARKESLLMTQLKVNYQQVKSHLPREVKTYNSEFDSMIGELAELGIDIKR